LPPFPTVLLFVLDHFPPPEEGKEPRFLAASARLKHGSEAPRATSPFFRFVQSPSLWFLPPILHSGASFRFLRGAARICFLDWEGPPGPNFLCRSKSLGLERSHCVVGIVAAHVALFPLRSLVLWFLPLPPISRQSSPDPTIVSPRPSSPPLSESTGNHFSASLFSKSGPGQGPLRVRASQLLH